MPRSAWLGDEHAKAENDSYELYSIRPFMGKGEFMEKT